MWWGPGPGNGALAIAKFPHADDDRDIVLWEAVALELADRAGIAVPDWCVERVAGRRVLVVWRFDRRGGSRVPFLSTRRESDRMESAFSHEDLEGALGLG